MLLQPSDFFFQGGKNPNQLFFFSSAISCADLPAWTQAGSGCTHSSPSVMGFLVSFQTCQVGLEDFSRPQQHIRRDGGSLGESQKYSPFVDPSWATAFITCAECPCDLLKFIGDYPALPKQASSLQKGLEGVTRWQTSASAR